MAKFDARLREALGRHLQFREQVLGTALCWTGPGLWLRIALRLLVVLGPLLAMRWTTYYLVGLTDQRLLLFRAKSGLFSVDGRILGFEVIEPSSLVSARVKRFLNQHRLVLKLRDGRTRVLRINTLAGAVSGQAAFPTQAAQAFAQLPGQR